MRASKSLRFDLNGAADATDGMLTASSSTTVDVGGAPVAGGDYLAFCGPTAAQENVVVDLIHIPTNTQVYSGMFTSIAKCA